jgi:opacity protein-like surface antigen
MNNFIKKSVAVVLFTTTASVAFADNLNLGLSAAYGKFEASGTQTNDTVSKSGSGDAKFPFASIFAEYNKSVNKNWDIAFGLDFIPYKAEVEDRSAVDESNLSTTTSGTTTTTNQTKSVTLKMKNHATIYIQPTYKLGNGLAVFGKLGYAHADLNVSGTNNATITTINQDDDLAGPVIGFGLESDINKNTFLRFEANYTDYKSVSYTNSTGTLTTANPELWAAKISIAKRF